MSTRPDTLFDKRVAARHIKHGRISRKEYEQYLKGLKDAQEKAVPMFQGADVAPEADEEDEG